MKKAINKAINAAHEKYRDGLLTATQLNIVLEALRYAAMLAEQDISTSHNRKKSGKF